ncbi:MAG: tyrosine-type recombinase/integrase [Gemmatimonadetes bacterium]|nr:tyrosine-type recombinase/integrase [Gemmatimonadota bacterium]
MVHQSLVTRPAVPPRAVPSQKLPKALAQHELEALKSVRMNSRDRALIAVLSMCGLRVSEACSLTVDNIHWSTDTPSLRFADKRGKERVVPMNSEVQDVLREWLESRRFSDSEYVICNLRNGQQLSRKTVWAALKTCAQRAGIRHVHPHMLRHTFGTDLADRDVPVERIKDLMGHASIETASIYISISEEQKRRSVDRIDRRSRLSRWWSRQKNRNYRFFARSRVEMGKTVGRDEELCQLTDNLSKGIDTLLLGPIGVGKSHLLALLNAENVLVVKTLSPAKEALINIAKELHKIGRLCPDGPDFETIKKQHTRTTIQGWTDMVLGSVKKNEFVLIVDDLSDMTASVGRLIDKLNRKFTIIAALPEVRKPYEKYFWRFDRVEIEHLCAADAKKLIRQCAAGADIEDYALTETRVLQQSAGNPRAIIEIVERLRKEPAVTRSAVRDVSHTGARDQIDLTFAVVLILLVVVAARFFMRGIGSMEGYVLAGIGSAILVGIRFFMYRFKR